MISGILFLFPLLLPAAETELAHQLFDEGNWAASQVECQRILAGAPSNETALLIEAAASLRSGKPDLPRTLTVLQHLAQQARLPDVKAAAATEAAWVLYHQKRIPESWQRAEQAFLSATESSIFLSAGALLVRIQRGYANRITPAPATLLQLDSCRSILASVPPPPLTLKSDRSPSSLLAKPGQWIVAFYRWGIRPAIGSRCSLKPSCSEYFREASLTHKLLAFPMIADRLVREPGVSHSGRNIIKEKGQILVPDPLGDHDFWMTSKP